MARIRSVKPEYWTDRKLARLSRDARLLYIALWNQADEHARVHGDARYVKGHCLPYDDDLSLADIDRLLDELAAAGHVRRYEVDDDPYLFLPKLHKHQRLETKVDSRLPEPPEPETELSPHVTDVVRTSADESASHADSSEPIVAQQVAGSRLQGAGSRETSGKPDAPSRLDVEQVCSAMAAAVERNDSKRPTITAAWRTDARLMLDRDKRPLAEVLKIIDWTADHQFWRTNVMAVPTLRKQYDKLRLQRETDLARSGRDRTGRPLPATSPLDVREVAVRTNW